MQDIDTSQLIFFTGAPGSKWSAVSHILNHSQRYAFDSGDYSPDRCYTGPQLDVSHQGAYFGPGNLFGRRWHHLNDISRDDMLREIDLAWSGRPQTGYRIIKCHHFVDHLDHIREQFPDSKIIVVMRPDLFCFHGWQRSGGFEKITYPDYSVYYRDLDRLREEVFRESAQARSWVAEQDLELQVITDGYFRDRWAVTREDSEEMDRYIRSIVMKLSEKGQPVYSFDTLISEYNF